MLGCAVCNGFTFLNSKDPFLNKLVPILAGQFKNVFPELYSQKDFVQKVVHEEEVSFLRTLETGIKRFDAYKEKNVSGDFAFELYDTFGFPIDLTQLMARERNMDVDMIVFQKCLEQQKERSRADAVVNTEDWIMVSQEVPFEFIGYDESECETQIIKYRN